MTGGIDLATAEQFRAEVERADVLRADPAGRRVVSDRSSVTSTVSSGRAVLLELAVRS